MVLDIDEDESSEEEFVDDGHVVESEQPFDNPQLSIQALAGIANF